MAAAAVLAVGTTGAAAQRRATEVAQGVYVLMAQAQGPSANAGFIVGPRGVLVIDSGTSHRDGEAIVAAVRAVTARPIRLAILTHPGQEAIFGATALQARGIPVLMHARAAALVAQRCRDCLDDLASTRGAEAMAGTRVPVPDRLVAGGGSIDAIGRRVRIIAPRAGSAPGALAVLDERSRTVFAGSIVSIRSIPDVRDADASPWHDALAALASTGCRRLVPAFGPVGRCSDIGAFARYLEDLEARVAGLLRDGVGLAELARRAELPAYAAWDGYESRHARNAAHTYLRLERALFDEGPAPPRMP